MTQHHYQPAPTHLRRGRDPGTCWFLAGEPVTVVCCTLYPLGEVVATISTSRGRTVVNITQLTSTPATPACEPRKLSPPVDLSGPLTLF